MDHEQPTDLAMLEKAAANAMRLEGDLARHRPEAPLGDPAPLALDGAISALRDLAELLQKESKQQ